MFGVGEHVNGSHLQRYQQTQHWLLIYLMIQDVEFVIAMFGSSRNWNCYANCFNYFPTIANYQSKGYPS
jgi:uncharacterized membrane protein